MIDDVGAVARANNMYCPGLFGTRQSNFQRRHACSRAGSANSASAQVWPPSVLTAISVTTVSLAHAAPLIVCLQFGARVSLQMRPRDLGLQLHLSQWAPHRLPVREIPMAVI
jgi:hypothetical protein